MIDYIFILSLLFLAGIFGLALKPSPIYGGFGLILSGLIACLMVLGMGGSFMGLIVFLVYLGGMLVVFGYTAAMAIEEYPETWGSNWLVLLSSIVGFLMEIIYVYFLYYYGVELSVSLSEVNFWSVYEVDDNAVTLEGGMGVAGLYAWAIGIMIIAGWSLLTSIFIVIEVTRD